VWLTIPRREIELIRPIGKMTLIRQAGVHGMMTGVDWMMTCLNSGGALQRIE